MENINKTAIAPSPRESQKIKLTSRICLYRNLARIRKSYLKPNFLNKPAKSSAKWKNGKVKVKIKNPKTELISIWTLE